MCATRTETSSSPGRDPRVDHTAGELVRPDVLEFSGGPRELDRAHGGAHDQCGGHGRMVPCPLATVVPDFPTPPSRPQYGRRTGIGRGRRAMKVAGTTVVVTGAGDGIGRELVLGLLARGARVAAVSRSAEHLQETVARAGRRR